MDRLEKAARALLVTWDLPAGSYEARMKPRIDALRSAPPPAPGGGEAGVVDLDDNGDCKAHGAAVCEPCAWDRGYAAGLCKNPDAHPTPAPLGGAEGGLERAIREAYSVGYSAGCAGAPNSVRVSDLEALIAAHRAARTA